MIWLFVLSVALLLSNTLGADVGCSDTIVDGRNGHCVMRGCCQWDHHVTDPELCDGTPDDRDEVCCYKDDLCGGADSQCALQSGTCQTSGGACSGLTWSGLCNNPSDVCCIPGSQSGDSSCVTTEGGYCQSNSNLCQGIYLPGKCAGAADRQCCIRLPSSPGGIFSGQVCSSNSANVIRGCDSFGCGHFGAPRGGRLHMGSDVNCVMGSTVYAPFPAVYTRRSPPYGDGSCCDDGMFLEGTGIWANFDVMLFYIRASHSTGTSYNQGDAMATHIGLHCGCYSSGMTDHVHYQLYYKGTIIDPTYVLTGP